MAINTMKLVVDWARQHLDWVRLFAMCFESDIGLQKALKENGFQLEEIRQKAVIKQGIVQMIGCASRSHRKM